VQILGWILKLADFYYVRKGTLVVCAPPQPPVNGGQNIIPPACGGIKGGLLTDGIKRDSLAGEIQESFLAPIDSLKPGDQVFSHDGLLHQVLRSHQRRYKGVLMAIQHDHSDQTLYITADHLVLTQRKVMLNRYPMTS